MAIDRGYVTLPEIRSELDVDGTSKDDRLERAIEDASRVIDAWCGAEDGGFLATAATRLFDVPSATNLAPDGGFAPLTEGVASDTERLSIPPLLSITSLKTDQDGDGVFEVTWTADTDYFLYPLDGPPYRELVVNPVSGRYRLPIGLRRVQITGSWGDATATPKPIRRATLILAIRYFKRSDAPLGILGMSGEGGIGFRSLMAMDPDVKEILERGGFVHSGESWLIV